MMVAIAQIEAVALPIDTYSVPGNRRAEAFARFAAPHLRGRVLDVGCGAAPVPLYLAGHPLELITGIDPELSPHPFTFKQGYAEALPFTPLAFDTVICATALDHLRDTIDVATALFEIRRVLARAGRFISWETTAPAGEDGADEHHAFRFTDSLLFGGFLEYFRPVALAWQREGMSAGYAEVFSVWEPR